MVRSVDNKPPEVPALKAAVEKRMIELGLSPTDLRDATGVTYQGLLHLRQGRRKSYQQRLTGPVCRVFGWTPDSIERILAGGEPMRDRTLVVEAGATPGEPSNADLMRVLELVRGVVADTNVVLRLIAKNRRIAVPAPKLRAEDPPAALAGRRKDDQ